MALVMSWVPISSGHVLVVGLWGSEWTQCTGDIQSHSHFQLACWTFSDAAYHCIPLQVVQVLVTSMAWG